MYLSYDLKYQQLMRAVFGYNMHMLEYLCAFCIACLIVDHKIRLYITNNE